MAPLASFFFAVFAKQEFQVGEGRAIVQPTHPSPSTKKYWSIPAAIKLALCEKHLHIAWSEIVNKWYICKVDFKPGKDMSIWFFFFQFTYIWEFL